MEADKDKKLDQEKRDHLVAEWILRIASLEKLLISKKIISEQEVATAYLESVAKLSEVMAAVQGNKN